MNGSIFVVSRDRSLWIGRVITTTVSGAPRELRMGCEVWNATMARGFAPLADNRAMLNGSVR